MLFSKLSVKKKIPTYVFFELTRRCNLNCLHCYIDKERKPELSTRKIREIIEQLKDENSLILNFSGGEVFTRKDFFDIAEYAKKHRFAIKIFTNGTLIDKLRARKIADLKPLRVEVTIYSTDRKIHDRVTRVTGSLQRSLNGLRLLSKYGVSLRIKTPLMKCNFAGYKDIMRLAGEFNAKYQFDPNIIPRTDGSSEPLRFRIGRHDLEELYKNPHLSIGEKPFFDTKDDGESITCSAGHNSCAITAYGEVLPCIILPMRLGNLNKEKFSDIWHYSYTLTELRAITLKDLKYCLRCSFLRYCNRCPGVSYLESSNLLGCSQRARIIAHIRSKLKVRRS